MACGVDGVTRAIRPRANRALVVARVGSETHPRHSVPKPDEPQRNLNMLRCAMHGAAQALPQRLEQASGAQQLNRHAHVAIQRPVAGDERNRAANFCMGRFDRAPGREALDAR